MASKWLMVAPVAGALGVGAGIGANELFAAGEAKQDLGLWPELLPTGVVVMVHVLQNMFFSIIRLRFH